MPPTRWPRRSRRAATRSARNGRSSGLSGIRVTPQGFDGAADERRDGAALGD